MVFRKRQLGDRMAFGRIPAYCRYELYMERYRHPAEVACREFAARDSCDVLDIGCGRGRLKYFLDCTARATWHGIEMNDELMRLCSSLGYRMQKHDMEKAPLPFGDESFDLVAGMHVLEHLANPAGVIRDMARVLRPGGLLVLGVPTKPPVVAEILDRYLHARQRRRPVPGRTCHAFSSLGFTGLLRRTLGDACPVLDVRGFRLFSARRLLPLEDWRWFYDASTWFGRRFASLTPEVNVILRKQAPAARLGPGAGAAAEPGPPRARQLPRPPGSRPV